MRAQVKPTKNEKILLAVTAVFICLLLGLMLHGRATGAQGHYTVTTEKAAESAASAKIAAPVNINTASADALAALPGIGETLAKRIVDYRTEHGAFSTKEEIQKVSGIGEKKFAEFADHITVDG